MPSRFFVYSPEDKDRLCQNIYEKYIFETSNTITSFETAARVCDGQLPPGCYTNFRDTLFHFRKMVRSSEGTELEKQAFAIQEHSGRALSDAATSVLSDCTRIINIMLGNPDYTIDNRTELESFYYKLNARILNKRISGMMIDEFSESGVFYHPIEEIQNDIKSLFSSIHSNPNTKEAFHDVIRRGREGIQDN